MLVSIYAPAWGTTLRQTSGQRLDSCFNPRTHVGCDYREGRVPQHRATSFNPRTRVGCDRPRRGRGGTAALVSIHAPAWGATNANESPFRLMKCFNSRTRVGCDGTPAGLCPPGRSGFNPRTRVGCDVKNLLKFSQKALFQSTHPRGVRRLPRCRQTRRGHVSIHAPAWGATPSTTAWTKWGACFNPRTRVGCDRHHHPTKGNTGMVSIHAPAWGATQTVHSTTPLPPQFQSTHPRGVRHVHGTRITRNTSFNPRTRVGCDTRGRDRHLRQ